MALIGEIRKNSWLLILVIGLALAAFILMDMFSSQTSIFGGNQNAMANVEGTDINITEFNRAEQLLYGNSSGDVFGRRNYLWNYFVEDALIRKQSDQMGLGVSKSELLDLQFGSTDVSPIITQRFMDPNTGQLNRAQLDNIKTQIETNEMTDPQLRSYWAHQEKEIISERLKGKLRNMVSKGIYTPTWMAEMAYQEQNQRVDFQYVQIPFDVIETSNIALTDTDFQNYLNNNKAVYTQKEETRKVDYVVLNVAPSAKDSADIRSKLAESIPGLQESADDSLYVMSNYGSFDPAYVEKSAVSTAIAEQVFSEPIGTVVGPYLDVNQYKAVKIVDRKIIPDSVRSRHILIRGDQTNPNSYFAAQQKVDSLKQLIQSGSATFSDLAAQFGTDGTSTKGGDLGYAGPNQMVKPFNDLIFFRGEPNQLYTVATQFGVHLVEITGRKYDDNKTGVQLAYLQETITPSEETQNEKYEEALTIAQQNRTLDKLQAAIAGRNDLSLETSPPLKANDYAVGSLGSSQSSRDLIKWAFYADKGEVSADVYGYQDPVNFYTNKYVIAGVKTVQAPGLPSVANIKDEIEPLVVNEKKAEQIKAAISGKDLSAAASQYSQGVQTASGVLFNSATISGVGSEPEVVAAAFRQDVNTASAPIKGNSGVFIVQPTNKTEASTASNIPQIRKTTSSNLQAQIGSRLMQTLIDNANIEDNRSRFY